MKKSNHQWAIVFDDPGSSRTVGRFLATTGSLEGNEELELLCPDGKERYAFWVEFKVTKEAKNMTVEFDKKRKPVEFMVLHRMGGNGKLQTWPPGTSGWVNREKKEEVVSPPPQKLPLYPPADPDALPLPL